MSDLSTVGLVDSSIKMIEARFTSMRVQQSRKEIYPVLRKLVFSIFCLLVGGSVTHAAVVSASNRYHASTESRHLQNNIFYHDELLTKEYRGETWTTASSTHFNDRLSRKGMMGKGSSSMVSLVPSISPMPSTASKSKGKGKGNGSSDRTVVPTTTFMPSPSPKGKGKGKGKGMNDKSKKGKGKIVCPPTVPSSGPSRISSSPMAPTPVSVPIGRLTSAPAAPSGPISGTSTPAAPPATSAVPASTSPISMAPVITPNTNPAPSTLPPGTTGSPTITPGVTTQPASLPPGTTAAPTVTPGFTPAPSTLPPGTTGSPTVSPGVTAPSNMPSKNGGTEPPIATAIPTPSGSGNVPTVFPSGAVPATPFRLTYDLTDSTEPNEFEFAMAGDLALANVEAYLRDQFSNAFGITINVFVGMIADMGVNPVTIDFNVEISFTMDSSFVPSQADIDALIETAFLPPNVDRIIAEYNSLPADSPFSSTQNVRYSV